MSLVRPRLPAAVVDAFFPRLCCSCGTPVETGRVFDLCPDCSAAALLCTPDGCSDCGAPTPESCVCSAPPVFGTARSVFVWGGPARDLVLSLKYSRRWDLARPMGLAMAAMWRSYGLPAADVAACVPLDWRRYLARGYNQSWLLAAAFAGALGIDARSDMLVRRGSKGSTRGASRAERLEHAGYGISAARGLDLDGRSVILVDDVLTTGATAARCARLLRDARAARVDVVTFARAAGGV